MKPISQFIKLSLFTFGSFSFSWILGIVLHELGHAIAMWITGGVVDRISISTFSWSYTYYGSTPKYPQFSSWSGILFGSALGLILLLCIWKQTTPYLVPFLFLGSVPFLHGGGYFLVDAYLLKKGDAISLIQAGVPEYLVFGVSLIFLVAGIYLAIRVVNRIEITPFEPCIKRAALLGSGILPYFLLGLIHTISTRPGEIADKVYALVIVASLILLIARISPKFSRKEKLSANIEWRHAIFAAFLGVSAIVAPFIIFPS